MRFSSGEMGRRLELARAYMDEQAVDALVLFGSRAGQAKVCWLTGYREMFSCYVVVPREGDPTLLVYFLNHLPNAREVSHVPAMWGGERPVAEVTRLLREADARRVGLVGLDAWTRTGMPYAHHEQLRELAPNLELTDVTAGFDRLLLVKSDEEVDRMRHAAELTDLALAAIVAHARPGVSEHELVAHAEHAYRLKGGQVGITFLRSMPMDAPTGCVPAQTPSDRRLAKGDVIVNELSASAGGYSGQVLWPVFVGADPTDEWQRLFDAAHTTYRALQPVVRHGATVADAIAAAEPIRTGGYTIYDDLLHGSGLGLHPPYVEPAEFEEPPTDGGMRFQRGMAIVLQPNPITRDERMGIQLGATTIVRDDHAECIHDVPTEPLIA